MFDVISLFDDYGIQYTTDSKNGSDNFVNVQCMFCEDSSDHLGIEINGNYANCWRCGYHNIKEVISKLLGVNYLEVDKIILDYSGATQRYKQLNEKERKEVNEIDIPGDKLQYMHKRYLRKRGFNSKQLIEKYKIVGTGIFGDWKYRIIAPVIYRNRVVTFQGRDITGQQKERYKSEHNENSIIPIKEILYNLDNCKNDYIGVLEGIFDVWKMGNDFTCCFGTSITRQQLRLLKNYKKVFFIFDPEEDAINKARKAAEYLNQYNIETEIINIEKGDPAELSNEEVKEIRKELCFV